MIRFLLRLFASVLLAIAVTVAVMDATRSIAISKFDPTPLGALWFQYAPGSLESLQQSLTASWPGLWDPVMLSLLKIPAFAVFAGLALVLYALGRKPERRARFAIGR